MKVSNMTSPRGNVVANQLHITDNGVDWDIEYFQSYQSIIVMRNTNKESGEVDITLDSKYWDYSRTTSKYRNEFLGEKKGETLKKIESGEYTLADLN